MRITACLSTLGLLLLTGCATTFHAGAPKGMVDVIAHRGASAYAPENTLASFAKAIELKADWFELDVHLTKDGQVVVIHDGSLERVAGIKKSVPEMTLAEIKLADAGASFAKEFAGERIPTLDETLALAKNRVGIYIEIKSDAPDKSLVGRMAETAAKHQGSRDALLRALMEEIKASNTPTLELTRKTIALVRARHEKNQIVIQSFSPVCCLVALAEAPEMRTEFLGGDDKDNPNRWPQYIAFGNAVGVAGFNINFDSLTPERVAAFHKDGKTCAVWTVDDPAAMRRCVECGADRIISNKPDVLLATLHGLGKR
jgi:glycerophosphoryl diester phosphodiesterase